MNYQLPSSNSLPTKEFSVSTQTELFANLKQVRFSGQLILSDPQGIRRIFYLHSGYIFYASGGTHSVKRWYRNLNTFLPETANIAEWEANADEVIAEDSN